MRARIVQTIVVTVALFDIMIGVRMLFFGAPELAHGADTLWAQAPELVKGDEGAALLNSLFSRLGAFSLHAGVSTLAWCWLALRDRRAMSLLLATYLVTGLAFFASDARYFSATPYFVVKQSLGALWVLALALHFTGRRATDSSARPASSLW